MFDEHDEGLMESDCIRWRRVRGTALHVNEFLPHRACATPDAHIRLKGFFLVRQHSAFFMGMQ
ncbi:MAG TPA: hypothetical protein VF396_02660, partial [Bradyrhizobium sp.]